MDKNAIKKYAVWARRELITRVSQKALQYGISDKEMVPATAASVNGVVLSAEEVKQRRALIERIHARGYEQTIEEVAYTWFNRFIALRFMEVNGYLPSRVRVFTDECNAFNPQILTEAIHLDMDGLDMEKVYAFKDANDNEGLFKYLLITQCNALSPILPGMFQRIADETELLFPDNLLREDSVIEQMIAQIKEEDWKDAVQIIGWLYQYYNSEKKDEVFAALKKNVKITKENIPAATQLFTPDWIVRYMVENSLGRLWVDRNAGSAIDEYDERPGDLNEHLLFKWKYYVFGAEQKPEVQAQIERIRKECASLTPEQIKCIDPCCGSGHILVYMFDVLMQIYESYGYTTREAVASILENNLYGLDIDDRAAQLSYFAVMMKARQYDRRFLTRKDEDGNPDVPQPHVYAICESNGINRGSLKYFGWSMSDIERNMALSQMVDLLDTMQDAKEYGSILNIKDYDWELLYRFVGTVDYSGQLDFDAGNLEETKEKLWHLVEIAAMLAQKYDVVVTNPPYMGTSNASVKVQEYVKKEYPDSKSDLFAVFIERCGKMLAQNRYQAMITQHSWMFLSSFEKLRGKLQQIDTVNMAHLGPRAFEEIGGEVVQTTSFVLRKSHIPGYKGTYCRLVEPTTQQGKEDMFLARENRFDATQDNFSKIPGSPVAYWVSNAVFKLYNHPLIGTIYAAKEGVGTRNDDVFMRMVWEVSEKQIGRDKRWILTDKAGGYRKWYLGCSYLMDWENDGSRIKNYRNSDGTLRSRPQNTHYLFLPGISWGKVGSGASSFRYRGKGFGFNDAAPTLFGTNLFPLLAALNTNIYKKLLEIRGGTINLTCGVVEELPLLGYDTVELQTQLSTIVTENISLSHTDWDSFETSWDFKRHPLVRLRMNGAYAWGDNPPTMLLKGAYQGWELECEGRFARLKSNEEELNRIFIDAYGLQDELTPEVEDKDVTVRKADLQRDIKSLISYAVGCMFGRYSLNRPGLVYAGGEWGNVYQPRVTSDEIWHTDHFGDIRLTVSFGYRVNLNGQWQDCIYSPEEDNIIPICDDEYFEYDIVDRFIQFIETVYGKQSLDANLKFIADALGGKGQPKEVIRSYFLNDFFNDHCKIYQKRPIYWQFDSGKKNGFKCLIYMHRYREDTIARIRTDYVHEQQSRYRTAIADLEQRIAGASTAERVKLTKQLKKLQEQAEEIHVYEEKIHHLADQMIPIDLDDGVKVNYAKFQDVLAKIK